MAFAFESRKPSCTLFTRSIDYRVLSTEYSKVISLCRMCVCILGDIACAVYVIQHVPPCESRFDFKKISILLCGLTMSEHRMLKLRI